MHFKGFSGYFKLNFINPWLTDAAYTDPSIIHSANNIFREETKEEKGDDDTLEMRHLMEAESFFIVYDMRNTQSLEDTKKYIQRIFRVKGFDEELSKMKRDQMCTFPISLIGVNRDDIGKVNGVDTEMISTSSAARFAIDYCLDFAFMDLGTIYDDYWESSRELSSFVLHALDYYYYKALADEQVEELKRKARTSCTIL